MTRRDGRELAADLAFLLPQYILYVTLTLLPFAVALPIIFTDQVDFSDHAVSGVGLDNILSLFRPPLDGRFYAALRRTVIFTLLNYAMVYAFGFLLALALFELKSRLLGLFFTIIYMPWMISGIGLGLLLVMLFSPDTGTVNLALEALGLGSNLINIKQEAALLLVLPLITGWKAAGFNMAIFLGGLLAIPTETIEAARIDGASYLQRVRHIYLPQMVPALVTATVFCLVASFGLFDELVGLGGLYGNPNAEFLSVLIYKLGFSGGRDGTLAQGIAIALVVFLPLLLAAFALTAWQKRRGAG
ncbi:carbohydrate ABC transporter permease [Roseomonas sp. 18066]|uniref:carbohydrate ABC transporter permease n=1 Tax=Roseomonas sp. 18066 TaxID=2681412 RepID=UPI00135909A8|nr:sugar ABC transporter permease [Roseomonas sp. 18066]